MTKTRFVKPGPDLQNLPDLVNLRLLEFKFTKIEKF